MQYVLIQTTTGVSVYQCIRYGQVVAVRDMDGNLFTITGGSTVIDANPPTPAWHVEPTPEPDPVVVPVLRRLSKLEYMNRFTDTELGTIYSVAKTVVAIEIWLAKFNATAVEADGTSIDLDDPRTVGGLQAMEAAGLIADGRAAEILGA